MRKLAAVILSSGKAVNIYNDLDPLAQAKGTMREVTRASSVEPDGRGGWSVQFSQDELNKEWKGCWLVVAGSALERVMYATGIEQLATSFPTRREALEAEVHFLLDKLVG